MSTDLEVRWMVGLVEHKLRLKEAAAAARASECRPRGSGISLSAPLTNRLAGWRRVGSRRRAARVDNPGRL